MQASIRPTQASPIPNSPTSTVDSAPLFVGPPTLETRFEAGTRRGRVTVSLTPVPQTIDGGWDAVYGTTLKDAGSEAISMLAGFPALLARVEPEGRGFHNWLGWPPRVCQRETSGSAVRRTPVPNWLIRGT